MSLNKLKTAGIIMGALAAIVLVTIAVAAGFEKVLREETTAITTTIVMPDVAGVVLVGTSGTRPFLQDLDACYNVSGNERYTKNVNYTFDEGSERGGKLTNVNIANGTRGTTTCNVTTYLAASAGSRAADTFQTGLAIFATFSAVLLLGIVGIFITRLFKKN